MAGIRSVLIVCFMCTTVGRIAAKTTQQSYVTSADNKPMTQHHMTTAMNDDMTTEAPDEENADDALLVILVGSAFIVTIAAVLTGLGIFVQTRKRDARDELVYEPWPTCRKVIKPKFRKVRPFRPFKAVTMHPQPGRVPHYVPRKGRLVPVPHHPVLMKQNPLYKPEFCKPVPAGCGHDPCNPGSSISSSDASSSVSSVSSDVAILNPHLEHGCDPCVEPLMAKACPDTLYPCDKKPKTYDGLPVCKKVCDPWKKRPKKASFVCRKGFIPYRNPFIVYDPCKKSLKRSTYLPVCQDPCGEPEFKKPCKKETRCGTPCIERAFPESVCESTCEVTKPKPCDKKSKEKQYRKRTICPKPSKKSRLTPIYDQCQNSCKSPCDVARLDEVSECNDVSSIVSSKESGCEAVKLCPRNGCDNPATEKVKRTTYYRLPTVDSHYYRLRKQQLCPAPLDQPATTDPCQCPTALKHAKGCDKEEYYYYMQ